MSFPFLSFPFLQLGYTKWKPVMHVSALLWTSSLQDPSPYVAFNQTAVRRILNTDIDFTVFSQDLIFVRCPLTRLHLLLLLSKAKLLHPFLLQHWLAEEGAGVLIRLAASATDDAVDPAVQHAEAFLMGNKNAIQFSFSCTQCRKHYWLQITSKDTFHPFGVDL